MSTDTQTAEPEAVEKHASLLEQAISETPRVDTRSIWKKEEQAYKTYDGRVCSYSIPMLEAVLGGDFAKAGFGEKVAFVAYCISNRLDPVRKQVYFIRYQQSEPASFVTSWEVFLDRAQRHPQFNGYEKGIIWRIRDRDGRHILERGQPCDHLPDEDHVIVGGWAKVHRKDRDHDTYVEVPLSEMQNTNREGQPVRAWKKMPTTMAVKTPTARALRQSFPEDLSSLYTEDESEALQIAIAETEKIQSGDTVSVKNLDDLAAQISGETEEPEEPETEDPQSVGDEIPFGKPPAKELFEKGSPTPE